MSRVVFLDSAPLSLLCSPIKLGGEAALCYRWLAGLLSAGVRVVVRETQPTVGQFTGVVSDFESEKANGRRIAFLLRVEF